MVKFLVKDGIVKQIKTLIENNSRVDMAVAYWGNGAETLLGLDQIRRGAKVRIICDLESGGCNPHVIKSLIARKFQVKSLKSLHAKVYLGDKELVVGSANASANGLGNEGLDTNGLHEAGAYITETAAVDAAKDWFSKDLWPRSNQIGPEDIERAIYIYNQRKHGVAKPNGKIKLSYLLREAPNLISGQNIFLVIYNEKLNKQERDDGNKAISSRPQGAAKVSDFYVEDAEARCKAYVTDGYFIDCFINKHSQKISKGWFYRPRYENAKKLDAGWYVFVRNLERMAEIPGLGKVAFDDPAQKILENIVKEARKRLPVGNDAILPLDKTLQKLNTTKI